nr:MAG TPA: hypothetical protein [Bacteriophage sp.]
MNNIFQVFHPLLEINELYQKQPKLGYPYLVELYIFELFGAWRYQSYKDSLQFVFLKLTTYYAKF